MALIVGRAVLQANLHIDQLKQWWIQRYPKEIREEIQLEHLLRDRTNTSKKKPTLYPPICGSFKGYWLFRLSLIPYVLAAFDVLIIAACALIISYPPS